MEKDVVFEKVYRRHKKKLKNLSVSHGKLLICFSGIPGSGKTHIAKKLEKKYKGVRINNDDIRKVIKKIFPEFDEKKGEEILNVYLLSLLEKLFFINNGLIILDSSIDRKYEKIFNLVKEVGLIFIIGVDVSKELAQKRVFAKHKGFDKHFIDNINRWIRENKKFRGNVKVDVLIDNKKNLDLKPVFSRLDEIIE